MLFSTPLIIAGLMFCAVAATVFVVGRYAMLQASMQRRLPGARATITPAKVRPSSTGFSKWAQLIDEKKVGIDGPVRKKLRTELIRAGYFSDRAIGSYVIWRFAIVLILPILSYVMLEVFTPVSGQLLKLGLLGGSTLVAIGGPEAYISRRQRHRVQEYRIVFPNLLDMLVVCVDAGLSFEAAFDRLASELSKQSQALAMNLQIMGVETRAGRSSVDALDGLADRMNLDEARIFASMMRQSLEMGTDIGAPLRTFSDEMRGKRLLRAEENANKLPVKLVVPLGLCFFPVILMVVMVPVIIRLLSIME